jgi:hypothetical protein
VAKNTHRKRVVDNPSAGQVFPTLQKELFVVYATIQGYSNSSHDNRSNKNSSD